NKPFTKTSFKLDFGDGSSQIIGLDTVLHTYAGVGTYNVRLILLDTNYCNNADSVVYAIRLAPNVKAQFITPPTGCKPYTALFNNTS
ncbi:PKD domain-containing protein, partial [Acinetobacter baumannii]